MVKLKEEISMKGIFKARIYRHGKLVEEIHDNNLIVNGARVQMARMIAGEFVGRNISTISFGTSNTDPDPADMSIKNQFTKALKGVSYPDLGKVQFDWELLITENNGMAILEFGLLTADGTLFARRTRTSPIYKESDISIEGQWTIIF